jgi:RND family efflux transporter MFP subunit
VTVSRGPVQLSIESQGTVQPKRRIELISEVTGRIIWVSEQLVNGGLVREGEVLLRIDPIDYQLAVAEAKATLADASLKLKEEQAEFKRGTAYKASNKQASSQSLRQPKLLQVQAQYDAAGERVRQAERDLDNTEVKVSFDAIIDHKKIDLGQYVSTGTVLMSLLGTDTAEIRLPMTAEDIGFVAPAVLDSGVWPAVELRARLGKLHLSWQGRLVRSERRVDELTRVYYLVAEVDDPYGLHTDKTPLTVGLFVDATLEGVVVEEASELPRSALHLDRFIYLVKDGSLVKREVEVLRRDARSIVVGEGLDAGESVILTRLDLMVDGMPVQAIEQPVEQ